MYEIATNVFQLQTLAVSEEKFADKKNQPEISRLVDYLGSSAAKALKQKHVQSPAYRISGEALNRHVGELKNVFASGNLPYARSLVLSTPMLCASCHTQLPNSPTPLWQLSKDDVVGTSFDKAELLYATRNYDAALAMYDDAIRTSPNANEQEIRLALKRKLTILIRVNRDFPAAQRSLALDAKSPFLPKYLVTDIGLWQKAIQLELKNRRLTQAGASISKLLTKSEEIFTAMGSNLPDSIVEKLYLSGLLYQRLHEHPRGGKTQELLYWLGTADSAMNNDVFFGLSFSYFRECIELAPTTTFAKRCFNRYEANMKEMYTGTRGYDAPLDVEEDLKGLRIRVGLDQI